MKKYMVAVFLMLSVMMFNLSVPTAFAEPLSEQTQTSEESLIPTPIVASSEPAVSEENQTGTKKESGGMSTGGVFLFFFFTIVINAVISFAISNRFYKMSKKESHIQHEIRALKRDIDEKFSGNVKEIKEPSAVVKNSNPNYSIDGSIERKNDSRDEDVKEIAKRWNIEIESDEEPKSETKVRTHNGKRASGYKPHRVIEREERKVKKDSKAKKIISNIFPLGDE